MCTHPSNPSENKSLQFYGVKLFYQMAKITIKIYKVAFELESGLWTFIYMGMSNGRNFYMDSHLCLDESWQKMRITEYLVMRTYTLLYADDDDGL